MFKARDRFQKITVCTQHDLDCALRELMDVEIHLQGEVFQISADNLCSVTLVGSNKYQTTLLLNGEPELSARIGNDSLVQQFYVSDFANTVFTNVTLSATEATELLFESAANIDANENIIYDESKLDVLSLNCSGMNKEHEALQKVWEPQFHALAAS
ncbi:hypothetical protein [Photobacterium lutimaris]|uniref:Uncharacterized protein n=1 Tax=Photobacterium lutimaris TaxID=388278 RepID=A0A2T3J4T7_9GAMM|nr:hypothetical protein [Photobacterium lutimaris]PSU36310.1 hypothetical protein C9I99_04755 [Photobacterium lutimaris]TDR74800.1 hypothetical protein DFP78_106131 [Photobacterium lutimaris]